MAQTFTIANGPHPKRRNQTRRFLKIKGTETVMVDGVPVIGGNGDFHIGDGFRITIAEAKRPYWWLWGNGITAVEVRDPADAIDVLRRRGLIAERAA